MNAVNLIPLEHRRAATPSLPGAPFLALLAGLVVALAGTSLYVSAHNRVSSRQAELSRVKSGTAQWAAAAARYAPAVTGLKHDTSRFTQLGGLLSQRADWSLLLGQIAGVLPAHAALTSLSASGATATSGGTSTTSTTTSTTGAAATPAAASINISGCAVSEPVVADTMIALRRLSGVSAVNLINSVAASSGTGSPGTGSGACAGDDFTLSLQFTPVVNLVKLPNAINGTSPTSTTTGREAASTSSPTGAAR